MAAQILDGKLIAGQVRSEVSARAAAFEQRVGRKPGLDLVLVGDDPGSRGHVASKERASTQVGIRGTVHRVPAQTPQALLLAKLVELNADPQVDGMLLQLPLPEGFDAPALLRSIDPSKDVDGLHPLNVGLLATGAKGPRPCTPIGCMRMLEETGTALAGSAALVVGRSNLVGKPTASLLLERSCTVTIAHSHTRALDERVRESDIVIAAVGVPELIKGAWIKPGAIVIDVGQTRVGDKLVGDVEFAAARERASWITPVPGGVGLMTIAMLLKNTVDAAEAKLAPAAPKRA